MPRKAKVAEMDLLTKVKANLIVTHNEDDALIESFIKAAVDYAETFQHMESGTYASNPMPPSTEQGVIMLASHFYESRDGSTAGFYADSAQGSQQVWNTVNMLFRLNKKWLV